MHLFRTNALCTAASVVTFALATQHAAVAQSSDVTCRICEVQLVRVQTIPSEISGTVIRNRPQITYSSGAFVLAPTYDGAVAVFRDNEFETIGRLGGGPGEFPEEIPTAMSAAADGSIYIVHGNRVSIIDLREGVVSADFSLPFQPISMVPVGKNLLATAFGSSEVSAFDHSGKLLWKRDATIPVRGNDLLHFAASGDTAYWVGSMYSYEAHLTRGDGTIIRTVRRDPEWFRSDGMVRGEPLRARPTPKVGGLMELGDGLLLFVLYVADSRWKPAPPGGIPLDRMRPDEYQDTILEIVDSKDSKLITSARYDHAVGFLRGSRYVWLLKEAADGDQSFEVFEPQLGR